MTKRERERERERDKERNGEKKRNHVYYKEFAKLAVDVAFVTEVEFFSKYNRCICFIQSSTPVLFYTVKSGLRL